MFSSDKFLFGSVAAAAKTFWKYCTDKSNS